MKHLVLGRWLWLISCMCLVSVSAMPSVTYATQKVMPRSTSSLPTAPTDARSDHQAVIANRDDAKEALRQMLESDAYSKSIERTEWKKIKQDEPATRQSDSWLERFFEWLETEWFWRFEDSAVQVGLFVKAVVVSLLLVFLVWLFRHYGVFDYLGAAWVRRANRSHERHRVFEPLHHNDTLPALEMLGIQVADLIANGRYVLALSLLYRGTLRQLSLSHELAITPAKTEEQCRMLLMRAKRLHQGEMAFFDTLVAMWQGAAYANRLPDEPKRSLSVLNARFMQIYADPKHLAEFGTPEHQSAQSTDMRPDSEDKHGH